ncbi:hypothetical protein BCR42DRAFT_485809 [Absidia repens]|uniref:C2H2-type domain-containing protein n=1 Tax=Absidia repens TaxID=90262 RepID=A0A1X2J1J3_9FUNG|nr:hypothetical protein BCR42DRAFT_485809 [Absidia repens]
MYHSASYRPTKRIFSCTDDFFNEGNIALRAYWLERDAATEHDTSLIREVAENLSTSFNERPIFCELPSCVKRYGEPVAFPSLVAYESHYEALHRNTCSICHLPFPGSRWLRLHLDELHDTLNQVRKDRGEKIHECYVETCAKFFSTPKMRRLHLIDKHHYPKNFPFDLVVTGTISIEERQQQRRPHGRPSRSHAGYHRHHQPMDQDENIDENHHHHHQSTETATATTWDMDMELLTTGVSRIRIPSNISFGRGRKPVWNRSLQRKQQQQSSTSSANTNVQGQQETQGFPMDGVETASKMNRRERRFMESVAKSADMNVE